MPFLMRRQRCVVFLTVLPLGLIVASCSKATKENEQVFLQRGERQLVKKDYRRAALEFQNAVRAAPNDAEAYYQLGLAYLGSDRSIDGVAALVKATHLKANHAGAQAKLAELLATSGDKIAIQEAERRMHTVLAATPDNTDALDALALAELNLGKLDDAQEHVRLALEKLPQNLKSSAIQARLHLARRDPRGAEEVLRKSIELTPRSVEAITTLGELYLITGRWREAETQLQQAILIDPKYAPALLRLATAQFHLGEADQAEQTYRMLAALPEKKYKYVHADYLFERGKRETAIKEYETLAQQNLKDREARNRLVAAYLSADRAPDAEKVLAAALKTNPRDNDALIRRVPILLRLGEDQRAEADLAQILRAEPSSGEAHYLLAKIYRRRNNELSQQQELGIAIKDKPELLQARLELSRSLLRSGSPTNALEVLDATPPEQKSSLPLLIERNWALFAIGDHDGFRKGIEQGLRSARLPELLLQDAVAKIGNKDYSGAQVPLAEMLKKTPEDTRAMTLLADSYVAQKRPAEALKALQEHALQHASSAPVQEFLGEWLLATGRQEEARTAFIAAKSANVNFRPADLSLAQLDVAQGKLDSARAALVKILAVESGNISARLLLASLESKSGKFQSAISEYRKVIDVDAKNVIALNNLAYLLTDVAGQPDEGLKYAQEARELAPNNADVEGTIGWVFYRKGLYSSALQYLQEAVSKDAGAQTRNGAIRQYHLSMAYLKVGDRKRGIATLEAANRLNPNLPEAKLARQIASQTSASASPTN